MDLPRPLTQEQTVITDIAEYNSRAYEAFLYLEQGLMRLNAGILNGIISTEEGVLKIEALITESLLLLDPTEKSDDPAVRRAVYAFNQLGNSFQIVWQKLSDARIAEARRVALPYKGISGEEKGFLES